MTDLEKAAVTYHAAHRVALKADHAHLHISAVVVTARDNDTMTYQMVQDLQDAKRAADETRHELHVALAGLCTAALAYPEVI